MYVIQRSGELERQCKVQSRREREVKRLQVILRLSQVSNLHVIYLLMHCTLTVSLSPFLHSSPFLSFLFTPYSCTLPPSPSFSLSLVSIEGWELLAKEKSDTVYRRFYKDTGLYQYKVIGRYHDISARDYLEVQVYYLTMYMY